MTFVSAKEFLDSDYVLHGTRCSLTRNHFVQSPNRTKETLPIDLCLSEALYAILLRATDKHNYYQNDRKIVDSIQMTPVNRTQKLGDKSITEAAIYADKEKNWTGST